MPLLCYLHFSFIFDKTYVQKNMKTKLIEKAKQISTEYKFGDFFRNFLLSYWVLSSPLQEATGLQNTMPKKK